MFGSERYFALDEVCTQLTHVPKRNIFASEMNRYCSQGKLLPGFICGLLLAGCAVSTDQIDTGEGDDAFDSMAYSFPIGGPVTKEFTTATGKTWIVLQTPLSDSSLFSLSVQARGFSEDSILIEFGEIDPVIAIHQDDLDNDGFEELYLVTQSTGPEAYGTIFGLCSDQDKSISMISFEGATPYNSNEGEFYGGYKGRDQFVFKDAMLTNAFPVYMSEDPNANPTGGARRIFYELVKADASIQLKAVRSERVK